MSQNLTVEGAAKFIGMSVAFLNRRRIVGDGPAYLKMGGRVFYTVNDLEAYISSCRQLSTSK